MSMTIEAHPSVRSRQRELGLSGLASAPLGVLIWASLPSSAAWAIGSKRAHKASLTHRPNVALAVAFRNPR